MATFWEIPIRWAMEGIAEIEADSYEAAEEKIRNGCVYLVTGKKQVKNSMFAVQKERIEKA